MRNFEKIINISDKQRKLLGELLQSHKDLYFDWNETAGTAYFVRGHLSDALEGKKISEKEKYKGSAVEKQINGFFRRYASLFFPETKVRLRYSRWQRDDIGFLHVEFDLLYLKGAGAKAQEFEIYGAKVAVHLRKDGSISEIQSSCHRDVNPAEAPKIKEKDVATLLLNQLKDLPGYSGFEKLVRRREKLFPLQARPKLLIHFWKGKFIYAWKAFGYGIAQGEARNATSQNLPAKIVDTGLNMINAVSGEILYFSRSHIGAEIPDVGQGLAVTPLGAPVTRNLNIVFDNTTASTYRLKDKTHNRDIIIYDANDNTTYAAGLVFIFFVDNVGDGIENGGLLVSEDTDGDKNWNILPTDTTDAQRTAGQQPEVDGAFFCRELYEWYDALAGGRDGWDNGQYDAALVPPQPVRMAVHLHDVGLGSPRTVNAFFNKKLLSGKWLSYLAFWDGDPTATPPYDYLAGSRFIVGHEYQHAITDFNFKDADGNPGLEYADWFACIHEGLSDVFGGLSSEQWWPGTDISSTGKIFRNLSYPRDPNAFDNGKFDHFADRDTASPEGSRYANGTILAHCAYLMAQGGVHQRMSRTPVLIPVKSLGKETVNGKNVYKAARIWYRAIAYYLSTHGALMGMPANDENIYRLIREACVNSAIDIYGAGSEEHQTTVLAFYAVGLHPAMTNYGADPTFLLWGADWWMSRPFIGISSPDWSSVDLFINNAGLSEWNALINVDDGMGGTTNFENNVFCRVRNVGDQTANGVTVTFEYAKVSTAPVVWAPMLDGMGNPVSLNLGNMTPGQSNFSDADQNTPPVSARVKWSIPALAMGETGDHFCIRATVSCSNDVHTHNNVVQSNVSYVSYTPGMMGFHFMAGNPGRKEIPVEFNITHTLPKGWNVSVKEDTRKLRLKPGQEKMFTLQIEAPKKSGSLFKPPYDGQLKGSVYGKISGPAEGVLFNGSYKHGQLTGQVSLQVKHLGQFTGEFTGKLDEQTGKVEGRIKGRYDDDGCNCKCRDESIGFTGSLRPYRRINVAQVVDGKEIGGISVQVQVPLPEGSDFGTLPPTDTHYQEKK